jgi:hypothetical protein
VTQVDAIPSTAIHWKPAHRIIRSLFPPIHLFEDIADPADWGDIISAEQKTNPRLMEDVGNLALIPQERRVGGPGATYLMASFTHFSPDRPSRFSDGSFGVLYAGNSIEVALLETMHHHGLFMARTNEPPGWTSQFREIVLTIDAKLHDLRGLTMSDPAVFHHRDYSASQVLALQLRAANSNGVVYPSQRSPGGECVGLFYPDQAKDPVQGRHFDYHWNGQEVDLVRNLATNEVQRIRGERSPLP